MLPDPLMALQMFVFADVFTDFTGTTETLELGLVPLALMKSKDPAELQLCRPEKMLLIHR